MIIAKTVAGLLAVSLMAAPAAAQDDPAAGRVSTSSVGRAGQRQTREQAAPLAPPTARINSRIANRVQSRIRNRIDRNYSAQADTGSAIARAQSEALLSGTGSPR